MVGDLPCHARDALVGYELEEELHPALGRQPVVLEYGPGDRRARAPARTAGPPPQPAGVAPAGDDAAGPAARAPLADVPVEELRVVRAGPVQPLVSLPVLDHHQTLGRAE